MRSAVLVLVLAMVLASTLPLEAKNGKHHHISSYPPPRTHDSLKFDKNGRFRIMQIADVHFQNGPETTKCADIYDYQQPCTDLNSTDLLTALIAREQPDLAIFTGDNIWYGGNTDITGHQALLTKPLNDAKVPYMMTFGNHDCERANCRKTLVEADMKKPYSLTRLGPKELSGVANYAYSVAGHNGKPAFALYVLDGGAYYDETSGYDFIRPDQVDWYNKTSLALEKSAKKKIPAAAFFHIPLPEYDSAFVCNSNPNNVSDGRLNDFGAAASKSGMGLKLADGCANGTVTGVHYEGVYSSNINSGLFSAFVQRGDVKMVTVGHDHINDYCASLYGVRLCYGGGFGYYAYGKLGFPRRARIIDIYENGTISTYKAQDKWADYAHVDLETF